MKAMKAMNSWASKGLGNPWHPWNARRQAFIFETYTKSNNSLINRLLMVHGSWLKGAGQCIHLSHEPSTINSHSFKELKDYLVFPKQGFSCGWGSYLVSIELPLCVRIARRQVISQTKLLLRRGSYLLSIELPLSLRIDRRRALKFKTCTKANNS